MAFVGAQDQTHRRILVRVGPMLFGIVAVHMHLPHIGMGQAAQLQVDDDQAAQLAMEEQQIHPIPGLVDAQTTLPPDEGEAFTQLQQEVFQPLNQGRFQVGFRILVLEVRIPANVTDDSGDRDRCWCCAM